jgi:putative membrane protein insertion efficiency factor
MFARVVIILLTFYQRTFSPDHGWFAARHPYGWCKFYPSCSEYAKQAIMKYGVFSGLVLSSRRVVRCHPWQKPSIDPVP